MQQLDSKSSTYYYVMIDREHPIHQHDSSKIWVNNKEKSNKFDRSRIYQINCNFCDEICIGQCGRNFGTMLKGHKKSVEDKAVCSSQNIANPIVMSLTETISNFCMFAARIIKRFYNGILKNK